MRTQARRTDPHSLARVVAWPIGCLLLLLPSLSGCLGPGLEPPAHDRSRGPMSGINNPATGGTFGSSSGSGGSGGSAPSVTNPPPAMAAPDASVPEPTDSDEDAGTR